MSDIFTAQSLVDRARVYLADDHNETSGFIANARWVDIFNTEYRQLYRKWIRLGLVRVAPTDTSFTGAYTLNMTGVLAIVGVAEDLTSYVRMLQPAQSARGSYPFWVASGELNTQGKSTSWAATGAGDARLLELFPRDTGSTYFVRWIPTPTLPATLADSIALPFGTDERMVLGLARRAMLKESGSSAALDRLIADADAEIQFAAQGQLDTDGPRVRRVRPQFSRKRWPWMGSNQFPIDPQYWSW